MSDSRSLRGTRLRSSCTHRAWPDTRSRTHSRERRRTARSPAAYGSWVSGAGRGSSGAGSSASADLRRRGLGLRGSARSWRARRCAGCSRARSWRACRAGWFHLPCSCLCASGTARSPEPVLVVGAFALSNAASTPAQGWLVDRFGQRRVLLPSGLAHAALLVAIVLAARAHLTLGLVVALAVLAGISCPPVAACTRAMWWDVVTDARGRDAIFALDSTASELVWTTGPLLVGGIVARCPRPSSPFSPAHWATAVGVTVYTALPATRNLALARAASITLRRARQRTSASAARVGRCFRGACWGRGLGRDCRRSRSITVHPRCPGFAAGAVQPREPDRRTLLRGAVVEPSAPARSTDSC